MEYRDLVKAQYVLGNHGNISLEKENEKAIEAAIEASNNLIKTNQSASREIKTVTLAGNHEKPPLNRSRRSLNSTVGSSTSSAFPSKKRSSNNTGTSDSDNIELVTSARFSSSQSLNIENEEKKRKLNSTE